mmetsp:Transcript_25158/g.29245  ORF Transcript_25158/g.29245 Transcript_25158/m.29245 type:complete len:115 (+) Transcript_25158:326-670(+)
MIKTSSMKTAPKGRSPPSIQVKEVLRYQGCGGIMDGIDWNLAGFSIGAFLNPIKLPKNTSGLEIPHHNEHNVIIVLPPTEAEDFSKPIIKSIIKNTAKLMPGYKRAVKRVHLIQ